MLISHLLYLLSLFLTHKYNKISVMRFIVNFLNLTYDIYTELSYIV